MSKTFAAKAIKNINPMMMMEELNFQDFGVRSSTIHKVDPSVVIDVFEALQQNVGAPQTTGVLFGRQEGDRFSIEHVLVTPFCYMENEQIVKDQDLSALVDYHKQLYSLDVVGWFVNKRELDEQCLIFNQIMLPFKSAAQLLIVLAQLTPSQTDVRLDIFSGLSNKFFKSSFAAFQKTAYEIDFASAAFPKSNLISRSRHFHERGNFLRRGKPTVQFWRSRNDRQNQATFGTSFCRRNARQGANRKACR